MNRYQKVLTILDVAVGGPTAPAGPHGAFWRGLSRDQFVALKVFTLPLVTLGAGANSILVKALRGDLPFGADSGQPDANFNRMPSGRPPVADDDIRFIQRWIDEGCPEDLFAPEALLRWHRTNAPIASSRTDDIWFVDPSTGWAVNSDGNILHTPDGGQTWVVQHAAPNVYLRCVGFADTQTGWVGTLTRSRRLFHTINGGHTWSVVSPLPDDAPVAVCGLSVVSPDIVFASGTNRPADVPRMLRTLDGGRTWTAWDMTAHASVLIDTHFVDALHGWVVGGKAPEPPPTTRDRLKPVVLETTDGGVTWIDRLAGQEDQFPAGEWGWKIQFIDDLVGFVSLENFTDAAILKTTDGGRTWTRHKVNDPRGNANIEGIGFIDADRGWVGGWGSADFSKGYSSATLDGGAHWQPADEIGRFINRFRFFGDPVHVGYASGDTVYKYSATPVTAPTAALRLGIDPARAMLPATHPSGPVGAVPLELNVPPGMKRLTLQLWSRFGDDLGCILDEIHPAEGSRVFVWDGADARGIPVDPGDYIVRLIADDLAASSRLTLQPPPAAAAMAMADHSLPRGILAGGHRPRLTTLREVVAAPIPDIESLRAALQLAIMLELATLPPYLIARWTITDLAVEVAVSLNEIRGEEMLHFGHACNLLASIGGVPRLSDPAVVPTYPGHLPGGVHPDLEVSLRKLSRAQAGIFMEIERPSASLASLAASPTIGEFYRAILTAFRELNPPLSVDRQIAGFMGLVKIDSLAVVERVIAQINLQGEGSSTSPEEHTDDLAHYFRFGEIHHGFRYRKDAQGQWHYNGDPVPLPEIHDMADIPAGGYQQADVPPEVWAKIQEFDHSYSAMLHLLEAAWTEGKPSRLVTAIAEMTKMTRVGRELITTPRPDNTGYGPCFRLVP